MAIEQFSSLGTALHAVHVAANAIRGMPGIVEATADNDNRVGRSFSACRVVNRSSCA